MEKAEIVRAEMKSLRHQSFQNRVRVEKILRAELGEKVYLMPPSPTDEMRLLALQAWSRKYQVSLKYVVLTLRKFWFAKMKHVAKGIRPKGLGVKISTFTGRYSEQILLEKIAEDFPNGENRQEWQWEQKKKLLQDKTEGQVRAMRMTDFEEPGDFVKAYKKKIIRKRKVLDQAASAKWRRRRAWRGNPWI